MNSSGTHLVVLCTSRRCACWARAVGRGRTGRYPGMDLSTIGQARVLSAAAADVGRTRERSRRARFVRLGTGLAVFAAWLWLRIAVGHPVSWSVPAVPAGMRDYLPAFLLIALLMVSILLPVIG